MTQRSSKDLMNMMKLSKQYEEEGYGLEEYDKLPSVDKEAKITFTEELKRNNSIRASTGHLRNMSNFEKVPEGIELPNIKHASKNNAIQQDLEQKLVKLKNLSQNDKEMIDIQRK